MDAAHDGSNRTLYTELGEHSPRAVDFSVTELYHRYPQLMERFGSEGRKTCRDDIEHHLEFLEAAIGAGTSQPFVSYIRWLRTLLEARGVPSESLRDSLGVLADYFREHASRQLSHAVSSVLTEAREVFEVDSSASSLRLMHTPEPILKLEGLVSSLIRGRHTDVLDLIRGPSANSEHYSDIAVHVIQPALYDVGRLWQEGRVSVAQEHLATATSQYVLAEILAEQDFERPTGRIAVVACVEANHHSVGARMLGDALMIDGWDVEFLGANTPTRDLVQYVDHSRPDLLALSTSMPQQLETVRAAIERIRTEMGASTPTIMVGGLAVNQIDSAWKQFGADIWAPDAKVAIAEVA